MKNFHITNVDLKLLLIFQAVFEEGSVTGAAERLQLSQPLVSHALERLRGALSDPLFVRAGRSITPTVRARELAPEIAELAERMMGLAEPGELDTASLTTTFLLAANDYERRLLAPGVMASLLQQAPRAALSLDHTLGNLADRLRRREWDLAITPVAPPDLHDFYSESLFEDRFACFFDGSQLRAAQVRSDYGQLEHAVVRFRGDPVSAIDRVLRENGVTRRVRLLAPSFEALPELVRGTRLVTTLPSRLGDSLFAGFRQTAFPYGSPLLNFRMVWHRTTHHSARYRWFRALVRDSIEQRLSGKAAPR